MSTAIRSITILGRRWTDSAGNTYHSVTIHVDGEFLHREPFAYGYDDAYIETAWRWLIKNGHVSDVTRHANGIYERPWQWAQDRDVNFVYDVVDVPRKRDL